MDGKIFSDNIGAQAGTLALKEQGTDVLSLVKQFIKVAEEQINTGHKDLSKDAGEYLLGYNWNGNEKELETVVKKACIMAEGPVLRREDFDLGYRQLKSLSLCSFIEEKLSGFMQNIRNLEKFNLYDTVMPEVEAALIQMVMKETKGNQTRAAKLLGINRNTLRDKIKKLRIPAYSPRSEAGR